MNKEQFTKAMTYLGIAYNKEFTSSQVSVWYDFFIDVDEITFKNAVKYLTVRNKFLPAINEMVEACALLESRKKYDILETMYKDGYFKKGIETLSPEHEMRNYEKATMWLNEEIIPEWLLQDMMKYGYKIPLAYKQSKELNSVPLLLG